MGRYGSSEFNGQLTGILTKLAEMKSQGKVSTDPQHVLMALDAFVGGRAVPVVVYRDRLMSLHKDDRPVIDRLLRQWGIVQATLQFEDEEAERAGLTLEKDYTNRELVEMVFTPKSSTSFELVDPTIYVRRVPGEAVHDLFTIPASTRSALLATIEAARSEKNTSMRREDREQMLSHYAERGDDDRRRDARTIAQLIYAYAASRDPDVNTVAESLTGAYLLLYNRPHELQAIELLRNMLEGAAERSASVDIRHLAERLREAVEFRRQRTAAPPRMGHQPATEMDVVGFSGWKTGQEGH